MIRITHLASCAVAGSILTIAACGGGGTQTSLPTAVALSPDGVQQLSHSFSPDGKRIAYWSPSTDSATVQLWVANADLSSPVRLPVTAAFDAPAHWAPDGASLVASSNQSGLSQVVIVLASGGPVRQVTEGASMSVPMMWFRDGQSLNYFGTAPGGKFQSFVYSLTSGKSRPLAPGETRPYLGGASPDGSHVAYFVKDGAKATIWLADGNGEHPRQLTTEGFESLVQYQEWSPDGKELLYQSTRTGHSDLWIVPIDGGKPRQLTRDIRDDYGGVWSPDGKWIAFLSNRGRQTDVWLVPAAGGAEQRVTDTPAEEVAPMQWRPGTDSLTFGISAVRGALWALDVADGKERRLTPESQQVTQFHPSPDGKQALYIVERGGGIQDLAVVPIAGGEPRMVVSGGGNINDPVWSPDGQKIAFGSDRGGSSDVWIADVSGSASPRQLTSWPGNEGRPAWSQDGSTIYFRSSKDAKLTDIWRVASAGGEPVRVTSDGVISQPMAMRGTDALLAQVISPKGQFGIVRVRPDGRTNIVWDKSNAFSPEALPPADSVLANVEQPDGKMRAMILATDGSGGRAILPPGQSPADRSADGQWVLYYIVAGGKADLGLLHLTDGSTRRLTTTPEDEVGPEFTPDGKTVLFRRMQTTQRITAVDLSKLIGR
jgi:TolB protein